MQLGHRAAPILECLTNANVTDLDCMQHLVNPSPHSIDAPVGPMASQDSVIQPWVIKKQEAIRGHGQWGTTWSSREATRKEQSLGPTFPFLASPVFLPVPYFDLPRRLYGSPSKSIFPRIQWEFTPGASFTRPPRTKTTEFSCELCPSPGM